MRVPTTQTSSKKWTTIGIVLKGKERKREVPALVCGWQQECGETAQLSTMCPCHERRNPS